LGGEQGNGAAGPILSRPSRLLAPEGPNILGNLLFIPELGIYVEANSPQSALIRQVQPGSTAEAAGLWPQDQIFSFGGQRVDNPAMLRAICAQASPGMSYAVQVLRSSAVRVRIVTIATSPSNMAILNPQNF
jgi:S1-C subfamily serine protease